MKSDRKWTAALAALAIGLALPLATPADAALVICQKGKKVKLRPDACKGKETVVDPAELGVQVPDGGVAASNLAADAKTAIGSIVLFNQDQEASTNSTTPVSLDRFTVDVPAAGVLYVTVAGQYWLNADATSASSLTTYANLGLCDSIDSSADCANTYDAYWSQDADDTSSSNATHGFTITRTVAVGAAGPRTFFVNGSVSNVNHTLNLWGCDDTNGVTCEGGPVATVTFVPGTLNITRPLL